jgi:hypothetical protein
MLLFGSGLSLGAGLAVARVKIQEYNVSSQKWYMSI